MINLAAARRFTPRPLLPLLDRIQDSALTMRLARGMAWSTVGAVSSRALALLASIITARVLGKNVFGELGILQSTNNMYMTFAVFGGLTATKYVAEFRQSEPARAGRIIALCVIVAVTTGSIVGVVMAATSSWAARLLAAPHLQRTIAISAVAVLLIVINETLDGILSGFEAFKRRSTVQFLAGVANFGSVVLGVHFFGLVGAVYGLIASSGTLVLLNLRAINKELSVSGIAVRWREARREIRVLTTFSVPTICSGAVFVPAMWLANMILVNGPGGYAEMGAFSAADRWRTAIMFLPALLGSVALPMLSNLRSEGEPRTYYRLLFLNVKLSVLASSAVAVPVALFSTLIMASYGPAFREGRLVLVILCATSVAYAAYWILSQSLVSRGHIWTMFCFNVGWAVTLLTSGWLLRAHGATGLALSYLAADAGRLALALIYSNRMRVADCSRLSEMLGNMSDPAIVPNSQ